MKFSLVAALVVLLAVSHGSEAGTLAKRDVQSDIDKITKIFNDMSVGITDTTHDIMEKLKALEIKSSVQGYIEQSKTHLEPLFEQAKTGAASLNEQMKPLTEQLSTHFQPLTEMMEKIVQQVVDQTKALMPPQ